MKKPYEPATITVEELDHEDVLVSSTTEPDEGENSYVNINFYAGDFF